MKKIPLENGVQVTTFSPRADFDPLSATPTECVANGFPPMPEDPAHAERYRKVMRSLAGKLHYIEPTFRVRTDKFHGKRLPGVVDGTETSGNWSGAVVYAAAGQSFKWVEGDWTVPNVDAPTQNKWYYCASWIGIDGDRSSDVCQAGVECEVYQSGTSISRNVYPWWEWFPAGEVQITNFPVSPGDLITALLCTSQAAGSTTATIYFTNRTSGAVTSLALTAPAGVQLTGNCAEWIVEAPTVGGSQSALADYGELFFNMCNAVTQSGTTIPGGSGDNINMTGAGGVVISDGNLITPTVVQCYYAGTLP